VNLFLLQRSDKQESRTATKPARQAQVWDWLRARSTHDRSRAQGDSVQVPLCCAYESQTDCDRAACVRLSSRTRIVAAATVAELDGEWLVT